MIGKYSVTVPILKLSTENIDQCSEIRKGRSDPIFSSFYIHAAGQVLTQVEHFPWFLEYTISINK